MSTPITDVWKIIATGPESVHELRAFHHQIKGRAFRKVFRSAEYDSVDAMKHAFESMSEELNEKGFNVYVTLNPIRSEFTGNSATDSDIESRHLLLIDIDRAGSSNRPATDEEVQAAKQLAKEIQAYTASLAWPEPKQVMSGNGWHMYYQLGELVNNHETTQLIKQTLKLLAKRFNNSVVHIDTVVYNASRITKVPGTVMRKGNEAEDRPYRMAVVHE